MKHHNSKRIVLCIVITCLFLPQPTHLANFTQVQSIHYSCVEEKERKGVLQLDVAGAAEVNDHIKPVVSAQTLMQ